MVTDMMTNEKSYVFRASFTGFTHLSEYKESKLSRIPTLSRYQTKFSEEWDFFMSFLHSLTTIEK